MGWLKCRMTLWRLFDESGEVNGDLISKVRLELTLVIIRSRR
jgi:hypothetical protein